MWTSSQELFTEGHSCSSATEHRSLSAGLRHGQLRIALLFTFSADKIAAIEAVAKPERLATLDLVVIGDAST